MKIGAILATVTVAAAMAAGQAEGGPIPEFDFNDEVAPIKRLNGMCNTLRLKGNRHRERAARYKKMFLDLEIPETRFHDVVAENPGIQLVDVSRIFPLFHADENDPRNYVFGPTDLYLAGAREVGGELEFRFGEQIEHQAVHFQIRPPTDVAKWARICVNIARHYNDGWANGFKWNIRRFSVWEEPDNDNLLHDSTRGAYDKCYLPMYAAVARGIKERWPEAQVGGANTMGVGPTLDRFLAYCKKEKLPLDFLAYTSYQRDPEVFFQGVRDARLRADAAGFGKAEIEVSEWHYAPSDWGLSVRDFVAWRKELTGMDSAAYAAAVLIQGQQEPIDHMFYYAAHVGCWSIMQQGEVYPVYYVLRDFAKVAHDARRVAGPLLPTPGWYVLATRGKDGRRQLLVAALGAKSGLELSLKGVGALKAMVVASKGEPVEFSEFAFDGGVLRLPQPAAASIYRFVGD